MVLNCRDGIKHHHRRSIRLPEYDYTRAGAYFVTLVTQGREDLFGEISGGVMHLNEFGLLVENEWRRLEKRFGRVGIDEFVVMPNHLHAIIWIAQPDAARPAGAGQFKSGADAPHGGSDVGAGQENYGQSGESSLAPPLPTPPLPAPPLRITTSQQIHASLPDTPPQQISPHGAFSAPLGTIVGSFKSTTARLINGLRSTTGAPVWQRNYYEHIIRDEKEWSTHPRLHCKPTSATGEPTRKTDDHLPNHPPGEALPRLCRGPASPPHPLFTPKFTP